MDIAGLYVALSLLWISRPTGPWGGQYDGLSPRGVEQGTACSRAIRLNEAAAGVPGAAKFGAGEGDQFSRCVSANKLGSR